LDKKEKVPEFSTYNTPPPPYFFENLGGGLEVSNYRKSDIHRKIQKKFLPAAGCGYFGFIYNFFLFRLQYRLEISARLAEISAGEVPLYPKAEFLSNSEIFACKSPIYTHAKISRVYHRVFYPPKFLSSVYCRNFYVVRKFRPEISATFKDVNL